MRLGWLICLLVSVRLAHAQVISYDKLTLKFTPTSLLTPQTPAWQLGLEYRPRIDFGLQTDVASNLGGLQYTNACYFCSGKSQSALNYKWRTEARWYFTPERRHSFYWAQELFMVVNRYQNLNGFGKRDSIYYSLPLANVRTVGIGLATKLGYVFRLSNRLRGDVFFGVGIRRSERRADVVNEKKIGSAFDPFFENIFDLRQPTEVNFLPHVSVGARVGYVLWKFKPEARASETK